MIEFITAITFSHAPIVILLCVFLLLTFIIPEN